MDFVWFGASKLFWWIYDEVLSKYIRILINYYNRPKTHNLARGGRAGGLLKGFLTILRLLIKMQILVRPGGLDWWVSSLFHG